MSISELAPGPLVLTLSCEDREGIVAAVSDGLFRNGGFILDSQQFSDEGSGRFFLRMVCRASEAGHTLDAAEMKRWLAPIADRFAMDWNVNPLLERPRAMVAVSKASHCLNDLLYRWRTGSLAMDLVGVFSNHAELESLVTWHGLPFRHLPVGPENRAQQECQITEFMAATGAEYLILARYMQVLTASLAEQLNQRCINIHHSFLPSFKGSRPYERAHELGVKLVGATSHFVTPDLDEGPIIEQAVERVDHRLSAKGLARLGQDTEAKVLARAVNAVGERRVFVAGRRTIVFQ